MGRGRRACVTLRLEPWLPWLFRTVLGSTSESCDSRWDSASCCEAPENGPWASVSVRSFWSPVSFFLPNSLVIFPDRGPP